jgi:hypothetical protein
MSIDTLNTQSIMTNPNIKEDIWTKFKRIISGKVNPVDIAKFDKPLLEEVKFEDSEKFIPRNPIIEPLPPAENLYQKMKTIIAAQPSEEESKAYDEIMIKGIEKGAQERIMESSYDITEKPVIAEYASQVKLITEIDKVFKEFDPEDLQGILSSAPIIESIPDENGKENIDPYSVKNKRDYLVYQAVNLIDKAQEQGAKLPKFDNRTGEPLPKNSISALKAAIQFFNPKVLDSNEKDYTEVATLMSVLAPKQRMIPEEAAKWRPGGYMFESSFKNFIGNGPDQFTREELIDLFNKLNSN